jgi:hypothetical protein
MGYQLLTAPAAEPLLLADVKAHLRVDIDDEDALITMLIAAVRNYAEQITARSFITQKWKLVLDAFPGPSEPTTVPWGTGFSLPGNAVLLEKGPITAIDSIQYVDMSGATLTAAAGSYVADLSGPLARVTPRFGQIWPVTLPQIGSATINFTAGYGADSAAVPQGLKNWMLLRIGALYKNREEVAVLQRGESVDKMPFIDSLLDPYRIWRV